MVYAILAAGQGSRLSQEGIAASKPVVPLQGEPLLGRLVRVFCNNEAKAVHVAANVAMADVAAFLREQLPQVHVVPCATPSSMHSFYKLSPYLAEEPFIMTTVDTVFRPEEFAAYKAEFQRVLATGEADGLMGVTTYIDDEKPLYVRVGSADSLITDFLDRDAAPRHVSAGIYGLSPRLLPTLRRCMEGGESRMRNYQRALLRDGFRLKAFEFSKVIDIDHASDLAKAEQMLSRP